MNKLVIERQRKGTAMASVHQNETAPNPPTFELASWQAALAFERTLISLDQTLMGAVRTSLALISFGFALILFFHQFSGEIGVNLRFPARNFGLGLVAMGTGLVTIGLLGHRKRFTVLKSKMDELHQRKLLAESCPYRQSATAIFALLLLFIGLLAMAAVLVRILPTI
jgi:putative membrane protein